MTKRGCRTIACTSVLALVALALVAATPAFGQFRQRPGPLDPNSGCGGNLNGTVVTAAPIFVGQTVDIQYTLGVTASGGTANTQTITEFDFDLDCANGGSFASCTEESNNPISWAGGTTVTTTTCKDATSTLVTWTTAHTASATPDTVVLTPSSPVVLANATSCTIDVNVHVNNVGNDSSPNLITEAASFTGSCDTGLPGGGIGGDGFTVDVCAGQLDKQVSCDQGATWHDVSIAQTGETADDPGNASTLGCTAFTGDTVLVRYVLKNTGTTAITGCTLNDTNTGLTGLPTLPSTLAAGATFDSDSTALHANDAHEVCSGTILEPDTASVTGCSCGSGVSPSIASDTATFTCESCSVKVDKQVTCNGTTVDQTCCNAGSTTEPFGCSTAAGCDPNNCASPSDPTCLQSSSCIGFNAYCTNNTTGVITNPTCVPAGSATGCTCPAGSTLTPGQNIDVNYFIENTGQDSVTCTGTGTDGTTVLGFTDTDLMIASNSNPAEGTVNTCFNGSTTNCGTSSPSTQEIGAVDPCSPNLSTAEVNGDTASLQCQCNALSNNTTIRFVNASDSAIFSCQQPELTLTKTCGSVATGNTAPVSVTATNNGTAPLANCTITDSYLPGVSCPQAAGTGTTPVTLSGATQPFTLAGSGGATTLIGNTGVLTANACNEASVTCNIGTSTGPAITASAQATCPVGSGCEGATPGFFKNHPETVDEVILGDVGTITSCGLVLNNAEPNQDCSVLNDLAMEESSLKKANNIDPTYRQLVLQCVVAELNLQGTVIDGGNCGNQIPGSTLMFDTCCGLTGVCATGTTDPITGATVSQCQAAVAAFNADRPCLNPSACVLNPGGAAQSSEVKTVNTLNDPPGTVGVDCGGTRNWVTTSKKK